MFFSGAECAGGALLGHYAPSVAFFTDFLQLIRVYLEIVRLFKFCLNKNFQDFALQT